MPEIFKWIYSHSIFIVNTYIHYKMPKDMSEAACGFIKMSIWICLKLHADLSKGACGFDRNRSEAEYGFVRICIKIGKKNANVYFRCCLCICQKQRLDFSETACYLSHYIWCNERLRTSFTISRPTFSIPWKSGTETWNHL